MLKSAGVSGREHGRRALGSTGLGLGLAGRQIWFQAEGEKVLERQEKVS